MSSDAPTTEEDKRLADARESGVGWRRWGPYVSERQWGTVREDYSADGDAWEAFTYEHARSRAYRWGEDGIAGISDEHQRLCFALTLWNGADEILKERLFGLTGHEGNHGEDVKECYFHLDNLPTHAYMKYLYKYPQQAFPYAALRAENARRTRNDPEYELLDTGIFDADRYFDVFVEYAKAGPDDVLIRISAANRGPDAAQLHLQPTLWFRNDWAWTAGRERGRIALASDRANVLHAQHAGIESYWLHFDAPARVLFTDNDSNAARLWGRVATGYAKDGFDDCIVHGNEDAVNPAQIGSKAAPYYRFDVAAGETRVVRLRLTNDGGIANAIVDRDFDAVFERRIAEADAFYRRVTPFDLPAELRAIQRQAFAGLLWNKQYYHYVVAHWLRGDEDGPPPPAARWQGRNHDWQHFAAADILSMPDKWEYPWFAAWDTAFHCVALALIDADFAKQQLLLLTREWYMHPNGQIPAYEWAFGDVNPPVHAWAAIRICQIERKMTGRMDLAFLKRVFRKLLINFTWWVNRKDAQGNNLFEGGFLGLDNIGAFDRSAGLPEGGELEQVDGTSWMAMYCLNMLAIALVLAREDATYEDVATKFFEHFVYIGDALNRVDTQHAGQRIGLWDDAAGYYFDALLLPDGRRIAVDAFTIAGLVPLFAIAVADHEVFAAFEDFGARFRWFAENRPELLGSLADFAHVGVHARNRLALVDSSKLRRILSHVLDEQHMLSAHGIRSVSRRHAAQPFELKIGAQTFTLDYEPAESRSALFGGNSNWRGPVWFPLNFLLIEALQKHHYFLGDDFKLEDPARSGKELGLWQVTSDLSRRLIDLFVPDAGGRRPAHGRNAKFATDPHWKDLVLFYEYFDGETGAGLGASHQAGWSALVAKLIQQHAEYTLAGRAPDTPGDQGFDAA